MTDTDGSESIHSVRLSGAPVGSVLSDGVRSSTAVGNLINVHEWDLDNLTIAPAENYDRDFTLKLEVTTRDSNGDTETTKANLPVYVTAVNDAAIAENGSISIQEDEIAKVVFQAIEVDTGDEVEEFRIDQVPDNGVLKFDGRIVESGDRLDADRVARGELTFVPTEHWHGTTAIQFSAFDGDEWSKTSGEFTIHVAAVADAPDVFSEDSSGREDLSIPLKVSAQLHDLDGSETLSIRIEGVPDGASLSAGTPSVDGTWTLTADQLDGLEVQPPADFSGSFDLRVIATATDDGDSATTTSTISVNVSAVADLPSLTTSDVSGLEDQAIPLVIDSSLSDTDGSESLEIRISGIPANAGLSAGADQGDGSWVLQPDELAGLQLTPPEHFSGVIELSVVATSTESGGESISTSASRFNVEIEAVADGPLVSSEDKTTFEDNALPLAISVDLIDQDGSETLRELTIRGVPAGSSLNAGEDRGDGIWRIAPEEINGLSLNPPPNYSGEFKLDIFAATVDENGDVSEATSQMKISVTAVADVPNLAVSDVVGNEDTAIPLSISSSLSDLDGSESLTLELVGVPQGAFLDAGIDQGNGSWLLTPEELSGLRLTPPPDFSGEIDLTVNASVTDGDDATASQAASFRVSVNGVADVPEASVQDASGLEDTEIPLFIEAGLQDVDGSEALSVTISDVPPGALLSAGEDQGNGVWKLDPGDLSGLTIRPAPDSDQSFTISVTSTSTDGTSTATSTQSLHVDVAAVADTPFLSVSDAQGSEDNAIPLGIVSGLSDIDGSETLSVKIGGVPEGATLSAGISLGGGEWELASTDLDGLSISSPEDSGESFTLSVTATSVDGDDSASTTNVVHVAVSPVADAPQLSVVDAVGAEDSPIPISIAASTSDIDGSENLEITISGIPDEASLSSGTKMENGDWVLEPDQLADLKLNPVPNSSDDLSLEIIATSHDGDDQRSTLATLQVSVSGVADAPLVVADNAMGLEDSAIPIRVSAALTDPSEELTVRISGVPDGATLSAGLDQGNGTWILSPEQLSGLSVTPEPNSDADLR